MFNTTILFLSLSSVSKSPQLLIPFHKESSHISIKNCFLFKFSRSFLQTYTNNHKTEIRDSTFQQFVSTPLIFSSDCFLGNNIAFKSPIKNMNFTSSLFEEGKRVKLTECQSSLIIIAGCNFIDLKSKGTDMRDTSGGGLFIAQWTNVELYNCLFSKCQAEDNGGACYIAKTKTNSDKTKPENYDEPLQSLDAKYCCFQKCSFLNSNKYGVAMYIASLTTSLNFISTNDCPESTNNLPNGAQFDIHSPTQITTSNINTTGGTSKYCAGIEYRNSNKGSFKYQTVIKMKGKFITSFTKLETNFDISNCNYYNNTVHSDESSSDNPALIHIRDKSVTITDFTFLKTLFTGSVEDKRKKLIGVNDGNDKPIILINIYSDIDDPSVRYEGFNIDKVYNKNDNVGTPFPTFEIEQLNLGECKGLKNPEPTVISSYFTPSNEFTISQHFTNSDRFSKSSFFSSSNAFSHTKDFTNSEKFSKSSFFSSSNAFSHTNDFTNSDDFTKTEDFSNSIKFTKSKMFSLSSDFTNSNAFSNSFFFSSSNAFPHTKDFTHSDDFTKTDDFSQSGKFPNSNTFSLSSQFSKSEAFTYSNKFTSTDKFSNSLMFSLSSDFSSSNDFTKSGLFTKSFDFSKSSFFSSSIQFTKSSGFTETYKFTVSKDFSQSGDFSASSAFTESFALNRSSPFTKSKTFSASLDFTQSTMFSKTGMFSPSGKFTETGEFSKTNNFTKSKAFTNSNAFSNSGNLFKSTKKVIIAINSNDSDKNIKTKVGVITGAVVACAVLISLITAIGLILNRRRKFNNIIDSENPDITMIDSNTQSNVIDNPLYSQMNGNDDPFASDFDEIENQ